MEMKELTLEKFEEASEIVEKVTQETKLIFSEYFSSLSGNKVYFKPENMRGFRDSRTQRRSKFLHFRDNAFT